ncbi:MAG: T9SS type A sorting domain-containing protein [Aureispira sp.]|nr:T9SS type A sorting domain-containing protein [Aureispira sp.]
MRVSYTILKLFALIGIIGGIVFLRKTKPTVIASKGLVEQITINPSKAGKKKTPEERSQFHLARVLYEYYLQVNPFTGEIPKDVKELERIEALKASPQNNSNGRTPGAFVYDERGPGNLGGRTRTLVFDRTDPTGNTILAGGVSSGVFRTTDGGASWTKVSPTGELHSVTSIAQDPRPGFEQNWYYVTGENFGNSVSFSGAFFFGQGAWTSSDGGLTWAQIPQTNSVLDLYDSYFDIMAKVAVHPITGDVFFACSGAIRRLDISTSTIVNELLSAGGTGEITDVTISSTGRVYASFAGSSAAAFRGVWTCTDATGTGAGSWSRIGNPGVTNGGAFAPTGRIVMALAPSNENKLYVLYDDGSATGSCASPQVEADLWMWNQAGTNWTDYTNRLPNEAGCLAGNDPFAIQGGYDLCVSVKPDNEDFLVIGGTNAYKKTDINASGRFSRIGGYLSSGTYALYNTGGGDEHHPDVHDLVFNPNSPNVLFSGTDGGIHKTNDITAGTTDWISLNNNYQTYQYYFVALDPADGSDAVLGGAQDNGSVAGGLTFGLGDKTTKIRLLSGDGAACAISRDNACLPLFMSTQNGTLRRRDTGGGGCNTSLVNITPSGSNSDFVTYYKLDMDNNNILYYAGQNRLWRTTNSSGVTTGTWTNMGTISASERIRSFGLTRGTYNAAESYLFIGGDRGRILRLADPANDGNVGNAVDITPAGITTGTFPTIVSAIAVHPTNNDTVLAVYSNYGLTSIWLTYNATTASPVWTNVEQNITSPSVRSAAIVDMGGSPLYLVGTTVGLFSSQDPINNNWVQEGSSNIGNAVISHLVLRPSDNRLLVGTHGRGMFETTIEALPVELISFSGKYREEEVSLTWRTSTETNNKGFEVLRSLDGVEFEVAGFVKGNGTTEMISNYTFSDPNIEQKVQYYRLRQIDEDNSSSLSEIIAVEIPEEFGRELAFELYPIPAKDELTIELNRVPNKKVKATIFSIDGKSIIDIGSLNKNKYLKVDLNALKLGHGVYVMQLYQDNLLVGSKRFFRRE